MWVLVNNIKANKHVENNANKLWQWHDARLGCCTRLCVRLGCCTRLCGSVVAQGCVWGSVVAQGWSKRWWGGSGIRWTICKSFASRSDQITMPVPHHSVFTGRMLFPPPNQQLTLSNISTTCAFGVSVGDDPTGVSSRFTAPENKSPQAQQPFQYDNSVWQTDRQTDTRL